MNVPVSDEVSDQSKGLSKEANAKGSAKHG